MPLSDRIVEARQSSSRARILTLDIETQRAVVETWGLFKQYIPITCVQRPSRVLCFAAKWRGAQDAIFRASWRDDNDITYLRMMRKAFSLLDQAEIVITWNGDRFDLQWFEAEFGRLGLGRPAPYKSIDLMKVNRHNFGRGNMSLKLDWSARMWLKDKKLAHNGRDLWWDIRHGTREEQRDAEKLMRLYNVQDVALTERLFEEYLPWSKINLALYERNDDGLMHCTKCNSTRLTQIEVKPYRTPSFAYRMYRCKDCKSVSRGHRNFETTELRPV